MLVRPQLAFCLLQCHLDCGSGQGRTVAQQCSCMPVAPTAVNVVSLPQVASSCVLSMASPRTYQRLRRGSLDRLCSLMSHAAMCLMHHCSTSQSESLTTGRSCCVDSHGLQNSTLVTSWIYASGRYAMPSSGTVPVQNASGDHYNSKIHCCVLWKYWAVPAYIANVWCLP